MAPLIDVVAGARPNFMKIAPILRALDARRAQGGPLRYRLIHTGQHYDASMSGDFFAQLGIPEPDVTLRLWMAWPVGRDGDDRARAQFNMSAGTRFELLGRL